MRTFLPTTAIAIAMAALFPVGAAAHDPQVDSLGNEEISLHEITVVGDRMRHMNEAVKLDLKTNPVRSS